MWAMVQKGGAVLRPSAASLLLLVAALAAQTVSAGPLVDFNIAQTAICRPVAASSELKAHPATTVVEVSFDLSARMAAGSEADVQSITYEVRSPDRQLTVVGFTPSTTLASETVDGVIEFEQHSGTGELSVEYAMPVGKVTAGAKNAAESKIVEKKLAPKSLLIASGTIDRSHGVYFTLHASTQDSLQKSRKFTVQFEVPSAFRADYIQITCSAVSRRNEPAGRARFTVGACLDGDREARHAADLLAEKQQELFSVLSAHQSDWTPPNENKPWWKSMQRNILHTSLSKPAKPAQPLPSADVLLDGEARANDLSLPDDVAQAVASLQAAKRAIRQLNGRASE